MLAQTFMCSRSLTQGLDVINMEPSAPGVRTSVINSYLSNTGGHNVAIASSPNALMASLETDINSVRGNGASNAVTAAQNSDSLALTHSSTQDPTVVSPKIYSVIKNSILQALSDQVASSRASGPSTNVNALLSSQVAPGTIVDQAGAQINSFVNSLIFTVQSQTNLSAQEGALTPPQINSAVTGSSPNSQTQSGKTSIEQALNVSTQFIASQPGVDTLINAENITTHSTQAPNVGSPSPDVSLGYSSSPAQMFPSTGIGSEPVTGQVSSGVQQENTAQSLSNVHGWVVGRIYSSVQSMIDTLVLTQSQNTEQSVLTNANGSTVGLDSLIQSANSLFAAMGLTSTVAASTLQTALQDIQRNLMSAPAQGQWINVVA